MILFKCSNCGYRKEVSEKYAGRRVRCPRCKAEGRVGSAGPAGVSNRAIIKFRCPTCNKKIGLGAEYAGKQVRCAACRNTLIVPPGSEPAEGIGAEDDLSVLRAGGDRPDAGQDQWAGMQGLEQLSLAEATSPAVEKPDKLKEVLEDEPKKQPSLGADLASRGVDISSMMKVKSRSPYANTQAFIIGVVVLGAFLYVIISWVSWLGDIGSLINEMGTGHRYVQEFAEDCILLLAEGNTTKARELFSDGLYDSIKSGQVEEFSANVADAATIGLRLTASQIHEGAEGNEYLMSYAIRPEEGAQQGQGVVQIYASVWEIEGVLTIDEMALMDFAGNETSLGYSNYNEMSRRFMEDIDIRGVGAGFPCVAWLVLHGIGLFLIVSLYVVFKKADQPGWAIFIPFYNSWVLAEVGERPGWIGVLALVSTFIPFVGWIIGVALSVYITIGVAAVFRRGVVFGLGLTFLPFVFYPILAFASD